MQERETPLQPETTEAQLGYSNSVTEIPEALREIMRQNSAALEELTKKSTC
jgi:hypothetical protein